MMTRYSKNIGRPCKNHGDRPVAPMARWKLGNKNFRINAAQQKLWDLTQKNKFSSPGDDPAVTFLSHNQLKVTNKQPFQKGHLTNHPKKGTSRIAR